MLSLPLPWQRRPSPVTHPYARHLYRWIRDHSRDTPVTVALTIQTIALYHDIAKVAQCTKVPTRAGIAITTIARAQRNRATGTDAPEALGQAQPKSTRINAQNLAEQSAQARVERQHQPGECIATEGHAQAVF